MSILADKFVKEARNTQKVINNKWYIAKYNPYYSIKSKLKDCIRIIKGTAIAIHFKEDERNNTDE